MHNPQTLATLGIKNTGRRQNKSHKYTTQKIKNLSNTNPSEHQWWCTQEVNKVVPCSPPGYTTDLHCLTTLFTSWVQHWFTLFYYLVHLLGTTLIYIVWLPCSLPGYNTDLHCLTTLFTSWVHHWFTLFYYLVHLLGTPLIYKVVKQCKSVVYPGGEQCSKTV
jgi:hypothetical protein